MNSACEICKGACCESIVFPVPNTDEGRWLGMHATPVAGGLSEIAVPCRNLACGQCAIWKDRPEICQKYEVGGAACRSTVLRRRPNSAEILAAMPSANP